MRVIELFCTVLLFLCVGCVAQGRLYTKVVLPYSTDFQDAPSGTKACRIAEHRLKEPYTGAGITATWTSRVLEEATRNAGITNIYYADLETLSVLNGIYLKKTLIIYGD
ncbi:MAG: hypothetical protein A2283_08540 [Lentisphaerae bacterium RIFOXYA12_FULL_48_11]|nr:MAG: hypothetical protein A2283_08540 [Lentisphaerae bacterium RIFOXYA12_FULL_48_11]